MSLEVYNPPMIATYQHYDGTPTKPGTGIYDTMLAFFAHTGTHLDSPIHFNRKGWTVDQIPLDRLVGEGVVVDIPKGELEEITPEDLEHARPTIKEGDLVVLNTGWHKKFVGPLTNWEKSVYYATKNPGLIRSSAEWFVRRKVKTVLVDYIGVDHAKHTERGDGSWAVHNTLLGANIPQVQPVGGQIDEVTGRRCTIICPPVKFVNGDAFPVRVIAMVEE